MKREATCDYCGAGLECESGSLRDKEYWRDQWALLACDSCSLTRADDFPDLDPVERLFALRLRYSRGIDVSLIRAALERAQGTIVPEQLRQLDLSLKRAFGLHRYGERLAGIEAACAAWHAASHLHDLIEKAPDILAGRKIRAGGAKGAEASKKTRRGPQSKRAQIIYEAQRYQGGIAAKVSTIARRTGATLKYVRNVLKEKEL